MPPSRRAFPLPSPAERQRFRRNLLAWYRRNGRDLPWRKTADPYHILVSEIMLQQTQVDRVLPKYHEWLGKYPTLAVLAEAPPDEVSETWYPLGYNIRPKRLQSIAQQAVAHYDGRLPSDHETLLSFKGIGEYTAGAIRSFAFRERAAILDTNVARVLYRVFIGQRKRSRPTKQATLTASAKAAASPPKRDARRWKGRLHKDLWKVSEAVLPSKHAFDFNQALMDFGAMHCSARKPRCAACPMKRFCRSYPIGR
ncbi:MAG: A/G-specific adenine glycosylase [Vicinamibacterales bacterium]